MCLREVHLSQITYCDILIVVPEVLHLTGEPSQDYNRKGLGAITVLFWVHTSELVPITDTG